MLSCSSPRPPRCRAGRPAPQHARGPGRPVLRDPRLRRGRREERRRAAQPHGAAPRPGRGRGLVGALPARRPARALLAQQELHVDRRRPRDRRGAAEPRRPASSPSSPRTRRREPSENLKAMRVRDLLSMSTGHHADAIEPFPYDGPERVPDAGLPGAARGPQARHALRLQHARDLHALGDRAEGDAARRSSTTCGRASSSRSASANPKWDATPQGVSLGGFGLRVTHRGHRALRPALPAEGRVERASAPAGRVGGGGDLAPGLERQQPGERLGAGLRLPVLALPPRRSTAATAPSASTAS